MALTTLSPSRERVIASAPTTEKTILDMRYEDVSARLRRSPEAETGVGASPEEIERAERKLSAQLPGPYKRFLREFGWGGVGHWEVFGLGRDVPPYLDLVHVTLEERTEFRPRLPPHLVPIMNDGAGNHHCLDTSAVKDGDECPVVFWDHAHELAESQTPTELAPDFTAWLSQMVDPSS
jgi:cell wall assembly regulator SMI1